MRKQSSKEVNLEDSLIGPEEAPNDMNRADIRIPPNLVHTFVEAVQSREPVAGATHSFYRYPGRFSPQFARTAILIFTNPGDIVLDPFMGGGTTLVEARCVGRLAIGTDISSLATFVARVKTTPLSKKDVYCLRRWSSTLCSKLNLHTPVKRPGKWIEKGYQRNINSKNTWPIRKTLELALTHVDQLSAKHQRDFARCALLNTAQWALDCRTNVPSAKEFRARLLECIEEMLEGSRGLSMLARKTGLLCRPRKELRTICLNRSAIGIETDPEVKRYSPPRLILTSPPYPGVHVLYSRWQIQGRKETSAPFWIIGSPDGNGESFYSFGNRKQRHLKCYYDQLLGAFTSLARMSDNRTLLVQMVAFSDTSWQLKEYLKVMKNAGFSEMIFSQLSNFSDGRLWRGVPNRKWYASKKGALPSSKEVVLFHRLAKRLY